MEAPPGASLVGELRLVTAKVRELVGDEARPTICFDRGGWSPKLFKELALAGFDILTYRKGPAPTSPARRSGVTFTDGRGRTHDYLLADRPVRSPTTVGAAASPAARSPGSTRPPGTRPRSSPPETTPTRPRSPTRCSAAGARRTSSATCGPTTGSTPSTPTSDDDDPTAWSPTRPT